MAMKQTSKIVKNFTPPQKKKPRKCNFWTRNQGYKQTSETDDNPMLCVMQEEEINLFDESSEWVNLHEFEDMISDSSYNN